MLADKVSFKAARPGVPEEKKSKVLSASRPSKNKNI